jgi:hypothetical protein
MIWIEIDDAEDIIEILLTAPDKMIDKGFVIQENVCVIAY